MRLGTLGLLEHDLITLTDLSSFRFRKKLMPYFWHIRGTARRKTTSANSRTGMMDVLNVKIDEYDQIEFNKTGVGAFKQGGKRANSSARLLRDTPVNNRLGQALLRLERTFRKKKFVRLDECALSENPYAAIVCANLEQSRMTN